MEGGNTTHLRGPPNFYPKPFLRGGGLADMTSKRAKGGEESGRNTVNVEVISACP